MGFFHFVGFLDFVDDFGLDVGEVEHDVVADADFLLLALVTVFVDDAAEFHEIGLLFADDLMMEEPELAPADEIVIEMRGGEVGIFGLLIHISTKASSRQYFCL